MADDTFTLDLDDLKIRELEEIEEITGESIASVAELLTSGGPMGKILRAIGYIVKRREDPDFTLEQAGELKFKLEQPTPTKAAGPKS